MSNIFSKETFEYLLQLNGHRKSSLLGIIFCVVSPGPIFLFVFHKQYLLEINFVIFLVISAAISLFLLYLNAFHHSVALGSSWQDDSLKEEEVESIELSYISIANLLFILLIISIGEYGIWVFAVIYIFTAYFSHIGNKEGGH